MSCARDRVPRCCEPPRPHQPHQRPSSARFHRHGSEQRDRGMKITPPGALMYVCMYMSSQSIVAACKVHVHMYVGFGTCAYMHVFRTTLRFSQPRQQKKKKQASVICQPPAPSSTYTSSTSHQTFVAGAVRVVMTGATKYVRSRAGTRRVQLVLVRYCTPTDRGEEGLRSGLGPALHAVRRLRSRPILHRSDMVFLE